MIIKKELLSDLLNFSKYYQRILNEDFANEKIKKRISNLNTLDITVVYPFLLEIFDDLDQKNINEAMIIQILNYLETFIVRRLFCDVPTNALNKIFATLGRDIKNLKATSDNYYEILKYILNHKTDSQRLPKDEEFKEKF